MFDWFLNMPLINYHSELWNEIKAKISLKIQLRAEKQNSIYKLSSDDKNSSSFIKKSWCICNFLDHFRENFLDQISVWTLFKGKNKDTRTLLITSFSFRFYSLWTDFAHCSGACTVNFDEVNTSWKQLQ